MHIIFYREVQSVGLSSGYWYVAISDISAGNISLGQSSEGIIDTGTTLIIVGNAAEIIYGTIQGPKNDPQNGWTAPCSLKNSTDNIAFTMGDTDFNAAVADLALDDMGNGVCASEAQGSQNDLWILED
ncbi:hypothetical protein BGZ46_001824, partial [Entomortierella lignicola]